MISEHSGNLPTDSKHSKIRLLYLDDVRIFSRYEKRITWDDPEREISRPLREDAILGEKDEKCPLLGQVKIGSKY